MAQNGYEVNIRVIQSDLINKNSDPDCKFIYKIMVQHGYDDGPKEVVTIPLNKTASKVRFAFGELNDNWKSG